jgi:hypothetical protein
MKTPAIYFCLLLAAFSFTKPMAAQFVLSTASDSIQIFTQWGKEKPLKKNSPKVLLMRIENANSSHAEVSFEINFIDELRVVETSNVQVVEVAGAKGGKPKKVKLKFKPANYNPENIDGVDVEIQQVVFKARAKF